MSSRFHSPSLLGRQLWYQRPPLPELDLVLRALCALSHGLFLTTWEVGTAMTTEETKTERHRTRRADYKFQAKPMFLISPLYPPPKGGGLCEANQQILYKAPYWRWHDCYHFLVFHKLNSIFLELICPRDCIL